MLVNRKTDTKPLKPTRFNLGGLIRKKMTWKRSIDLLASNLEHVLIDLLQLAESRASYVLPGDHQGPATYYTVGRCDGHVTPRLRPVSFTTECVLLLNSDMTLHFEYDHDTTATAGYSQDFRSDLVLSPAPVPLVTPVHLVTSVHPGSPVSFMQDGSPTFDPKAEESLGDYRPGGYHPVKVGDRYSSATNLYVVCRKLGWGHFSTVWLCQDTCSGRYVAMKMVKLGRNYADAARDEVSILRWLQDELDDARADAHVVRLLDEFEVHGPNGVHVAMVFELMGENMLHLIYKSSAVRCAHRNPHPHGLPLDVVRLIMHQLLALVDYMHRRGVVHTDLKPENILLGWRGAAPDVGAMVPPERFSIVPSQPLVCTAAVDASVQVKVADLGNATYTGLHFTNHIQTRQYRSPEVILKHCHWGALTDVWSVGCLLFELMTGDYLFDPHQGLTFNKDEDHLAQIIEVLGFFPLPRFLDHCELTQAYFRTPDAMENIPTMKYWLLENVLAEKYHYDTTDDAVRFACDLMLKCLAFDPADRYDCGSLLAHPWFRDGATYNSAELALLPNHNAEIRGFTCEE